MDHIFITKELEGMPPADDLIMKVAEGLMTPDMRAAIAAGCTFHIDMRNAGDHVVFKMQTREKVSILKTPEGRPISVLVKRPC